MRRKIFLLFPLFFLFVSLVEAGEKEDNFLSEAGAIYLVDQAKREVYQNGSSRLIVYQKIRIKKERGKRFAEVQIPFDKDYQRVKVNFARTITSQEKVVLVRKDDIRTITPAHLAPFTALYSSVKVKTITFPAVDIGSIIEYRYTIFSRKSLMKNEFWGGFYFQDTEPMVLSRYTLTLPSNRDFKKIEKCIEPPTLNKRRGKIIWTWEKKNVPALVPEIQMPPMSEIVPSLHISSLKDWDKMGRWFYSLYEEQIEPDEEIHKKVKELEPACHSEGSEESKIRALYNYVSKEIRYVGLEMGIYGYKPHKAKDVFHLKYGDCKDKATLLLSMLKSAGIKGYLALLNTEKMVNSALPSPGQFNHVIVAIPRQNGYLWLDTTAEVCPFGNLPPSDQGKVALIAREDKTELVTTPLFPADENSRLREIKASISSEGELNADVEISTKGIYDLVYRYAFRYLKPTEQRRSLSESLNRSCPGAVLKEFSISNPHNLDTPFKESYQFSAERYGIRLKNQIIFKPAILESLSSTDLVAAKERKFPIDFGRIWQIRDRIIFSIPEGWTVETLPESLSLKEKFGNFSSTFQKEDEKIIYERVFSMEYKEIPVSLYPKLKEFYHQIVYQDKKLIILKQK